MKYPTKARINGVEYELNTDYSTGIECMEISKDPDITDYERALAIIFKIFGFIPEENCDAFLKFAVEFLQCGKKYEDDARVVEDFDLVYDNDYIVASFESDYHINLEIESNMHWWRFCQLLNGLTETSIFNRVREIRNYDLSEISDPKFKRKMEDAKKAVALPVRRTKEEQRAIDEFEALFN